jgi:hypothetical protein
MKKIILKFASLILLTLIVSIMIYIVIAIQSHSIPPQEFLRLTNSAKIPVTIFFIIFYYNSWLLLKIPKYQEQILVRIGTLFTIFIVLMILPTAIFYLLYALFFGIDYRIGRVFSKNPNNTGPQLPFINI